MYVKKTAAAATEPVEAGSKTSRQVLISATEGPNFAMRRFVIEPGGGMPTHTNTVEHEQYVLKGKAEIGIGEQRRQRGTIVLATFFRRTFDEVATFFGGVRLVSLEIMRGEARAAEQHDPGKEDPAEGCVGPIVHGVFASLLVMEVCAPP